MSVSEEARTKAIEAALAEVHGQDALRRYSVAEVKAIVYPLVEELRRPAGEAGAPDRETLPDAQIVEFVRAVLAVLPSRKTAVEYRARAREGHVFGEERVSPETAILAYEEALDRVTFEQPDETPVVERREVTRWVPIGDDRGE